MEPGDQREEQAGQDGPFLGGFGKEVSGHHQGGGGKFGVDVNGVEQEGESRQDQQPTAGNVFFRKCLLQEVK